MTKEATNITQEVPRPHDHHWRDTLLRREIVVICMFIFITDMILGAIRPTLSLFATSLGASLTLIGALSLVVGLTQLGSGVIIGAISDQRGRKGVLMAGMLLLALTALCMALITAPYLLLPVQVLLGLGFVSTITVGLAYTADVVSIRERSLAIGLFTTMMGLGYAAGSAIGGVVAAQGGYSATYYLATAMAIIGFLVAWVGIPGQHPTTTHPGGSPGAAPLPQQLKAMISNPIILAVCVGGLLIHLMFGGVIVAFFPIYAHGLGISQAIIGSMFAIRALASTLARLPGGILAMRFPGPWILLAAILLSMGIAFSLPQAQHSLILACLLIGEGVAYGVYFTIAQATIASYAGESSRGAMLGMYGTITGVGDSLLPFFLGIAADAFGLNSVFYITGSLFILSLILMGRVSLGETMSKSAKPAL